MARPTSHLVIALVSLIGLGSSACGPAIDRPLRGAIDGQPTLTNPLPPTLSSVEPRLRALPSPSPGVTFSASPSAVASAAAIVAPPIVRSLSPPANSFVPEGDPVAVSAVLVGRGSSLSSASLALDGADVGPRIEKASEQHWTISGARALGVGEHTAQVRVQDAAGGNGGYTWRFAVGPQPKLAPEAAATSIIGGPAPTIVPSPGPHP